MNSDILVVEDHEETRAMLAAALAESGFGVHCAGTVKGAKEYLAGNEPALIILDLNLPDGDGLAVCAWVRAGTKRKNIPIIALTGQDRLESKQKGFISGVDQYLTKPIVMEELVMWVMALLRRVAMDKGAGDVLTLGALSMDATAQLAKYENKIVDDLTRREFELLYALVRSSPRIMSRREILAEVWRTVSVENLVDTHLFNLRKKLPPELAEKIQTVVGRGFRFFEK